MNNFLSKTAFIFIVIGLYSGTSLATEIIHYNNLPVAIELRKGEERSIQFGDHVQVGITKGQMVKNLFRVQSAQGAIHLLPYNEFDKQRIQVKRLTDGRVILLDLIASKEDPLATPLEDVRILLESENVVPVDEIQVSDSPRNPPIVTPIDLTRFASQRLYGPTRLHRDRHGITETTLGVKGAIRVFKGENKYRTYSRPILAYQGGGYYLAAIHIKNTSDKEVGLDYLDLNLPFSHATFQHHMLYPNGTPGDSTVLYLISEKPLKETLYPLTYYQDLKADAEELARLEAKSGMYAKRNYQKHK
ncbi:TIGR03749 family integrating conjugative element protein (plasmid) [Microbulbifer sp. TRSA002]|uniref:TIGR03749 family integrating conjugative element protein n=1 Tax=Microbulbifer sp. TRSA002 TaxID=3243382 RepID=UPI00403A348D